jgi:hypothetical protein
MKIMGSWLLSPLLPSASRSCLILHIIITEVHGLDRYSGYLLLHSLHLTSPTMNQDPGPRAVPATVCKDLAAAPPHQGPTECTSGLNIQSQAVALHHPKPTTTALVAVEQHSMDHGEIST